MIINITRQLLKKKIIEYLAVSVIVALITWSASCNNSCSKNNRLADLPAQRDSVDEVVKDSLRRVISERNQIIYNLVLAKEMNERDDLERKKNYNQKLFKTENEIKNLSDDSLYLNIINELSRYKPND